MAAISALIPLDERAPAGSAARRLIETNVSER
jgi:hypothetical protein